MNASNNVQDEKGYPRFSMRRLLLIVTLFCFFPGLAAWLSILAATAIVGPMLAVLVAASKRLRLGYGVEMVVLLLLTASSVAAVLRLYSARHEFYRGLESTVAFWLTILLFAGAPLLAGILRGEPSRFGTILACFLCLSPILHELLDPFDYVPESLFMTSASFVTFVSAGHISRSRNGVRQMFAWLGLLVGCASVVIECWVILYFE